MADLIQPDTTHFNQQNASADQLLAGNPQPVMNNYPWASGNISGNLPLSSQTPAMQAASFINPYTNIIQEQINGIPTRQAASQAQTARLNSSPIAALTNLGQVAQAGTNQAGLYQAGLNQAGFYGAGVNTAGVANTDAATINRDQSQPLLDAQVQNINNLYATTQGYGPSLAAEQAKIQQQQAIANQMAVIGSQRGSGNTALGLRSAGIQAAQAQQQATQAAVLGRAQEQIAASQALTGALHNTQGQVMQGAQAQAAFQQEAALHNMAAYNAQEQFNAQQLNQNQALNASAANQTEQYNAQLAQQIALANAQYGNAQEQFNASQANQQSQYNTAAQNQAMLQQGSMDQQTNLANQQVLQQTNLANLSSSQATNLANLQAAQQTQALNTNEYNAMLQAQMALGNTNLTAAENYANLVAQQSTQLYGINKGVALNSANNQMGLVGAGIAGAAGIAAGAAAASDERLKTNIKAGTKSVKEFLSQLQDFGSSFRLYEAAV